jgi:hypothetical protein
MNQTTKMFPRRSKQPETYLTLQGPYRQESGVPILAAIATVLCVVAVFVWRML